MNTRDWQPTERLRWVERKMWADPALPKKSRTERVLQQWFAPGIPQYMRTVNVGEWRDVVTEVENAPTP